MDAFPEPPQADPPLYVLILKNFLLIVGAFVSATFILQMHYPFGQ